MSEQQLHPFGFACDRGKHILKLFNSWNFRTPLYNTIFCRLCGHRGRTASYPTAPVTDLCVQNYAHSPQYSPTVKILQQKSLAVETEVLSLK